jgi:cysteinyl-tRNA synthetase
MYPGEITRYWALTGSYRSQVVFSDEALGDARLAYDRLKIFLESARQVLGEAAPEGRVITRGDDDVEGSGYVTRFIAAMDDDFNSAGALAVVHDLVRAGNKVIERAQRGDDSATDELSQLVSDFLELTDVLGLDFPDTVASSELVEGLVDYLLELREEARGEKAFARADAIREKLIELGVAVEDTPAGPRWRVGSASD